MNSAVRAIQRIVFKKNAAEFFVSLRQKVNFLRKFVPRSVRHKFTSIGRFIPQSSAYPKDYSYSIQRDHTNFRINRSDYVQWRLFYGVRDNALKLAKENLRPNSVVLDIGANFGAFSLRLATHAHLKKIENVHIHAFEPNPLVHQLYRENLRLNAAHSEFVIPHGIGLGSETSERSFQFPEINTGAGRVVKKDISGQFSVSLRTLDDFVSELNPKHISFIKMIVEGFEPEVFKGGWKTIKKYRPPIFFEVTPDWYADNNGSLDEILDELSALGYRFKGEFHNEMIPYTPTVFKSLYQFNLMAEV
jgi:FkbM family methyltransferase